MMWKYFVIIVVDVFLGDNMDIFTIVVRDVCGAWLYEICRWY